MRACGAASISAAPTVDGAEIGRRIGEIALREFAGAPRKTTQLGDRP